MCSLRGRMGSEPKSALFRYQRSVRAAVTHSGRTQKNSHDVVDQSETCSNRCGPTSRRCTNYVPRWTSDKLDLGALSQYSALQKMLFNYSLSAMGQHASLSCSKCNPSQISFCNSCRTLHAALQRQAKCCTHCMSQLCRHALTYQLHGSVKQKLVLMSAECIQAYSSKATFMCFWPASTWYGHSCQALGLTASSMGHLQTLICNPTKFASKIMHAPLHMAGHKLDSTGDDEQCPSFRVNYISPVAAAAFLVGGVAQCTSRMDDMKATEILCIVPEKKCLLQAGSCSAKQDSLVRL